ncbi:unnamed protein product [Chrysoparadoxa australica]
MAPRVRKAKHSTVADLLAGILGDTTINLNSIEGLPEQFTAIKKAYFRRVLECHPDKGGDAEEFREVQASFEVLRDLYTANRIDSFTEATAQQSTSAVGGYDDLWKEYAKAAPQTYEYYRAAAEEPIPGYRVEPAKRGTGECHAKGKAVKHGEGKEAKYIAKGEVRAGWLDPNSGAYSGWCHLRCWRVPNTIWLGFPKEDQPQGPEAYIEALARMDQVSMTGFSELTESDKLLFLQHVRDQRNWTRITRKKTPAPSAPDAVVSRGVPVPIPLNHPAAAAAAAAAAGGVEMAAGDASGAVVPRAPTAIPFTVLQPGRNGAVPGALLGKTIVLTGVFPEVGGGTGLNLGKDRLKAMIKSFGGKVTGSVSGRTNYLIVGKEPGISKVSQAREKGIQMMDTRALTEACMGTPIAELPPVAPITSFSAGYRGNSLAIGASPHELALAAGYVQAIQPEPVQKRDAPSAEEAKPGKKQKVESFGDGGGYDADNPPTLAEISMMKLKELKGMLRSMRLRLTGNKPELAARLRQALGYQ